MPRSPSNCVQPVSIDGPRPDSEDIGVVRYTIKAQIVIEMPVVGVVREVIRIFHEIWEVEVSHIDIEASNMPISLSRLLLKLPPEPPRDSRRTTIIAKDVPPSNSTAGHDKNYFSERSSQMDTMRRSTYHRQREMHVLSASPNLTTASERST